MWRCGVADNILPRSIYHNIEQANPRGIKFLISENARVTRLAALGQFNGHRRPTLPGSTLGKARSCHYYPSPLSVITVHCHISRQEDEGSTQWATESNYDIKIFVNCKM